MIPKSHRSSDQAMRQNNGQRTMSGIMRRTEES
jgi:hypothetical protein